MPEDGLTNTAKKKSDRDSHKISHVPSFGALWRILPVPFNVKIPFQFFHGSILHAPPFFSCVEYLIRIHQTASACRKSRKRLAFRPVSDKSSLESFLHQKRVAQTIPHRFGGDLRPPHEKSVVGNLPMGRGGISRHCKRDFAKIGVDVGRNDHWCLIHRVIQRWQFQIRQPKKRKFFFGRRDILMNGQSFCFKWLVHYIFQAAFRTA